MMEVLRKVQVYLLMEVSLGEVGNNIVGVSLRFLEFRMNDPFAKFMEAVADVCGSSPQKI